ncbi:(3S 6E)-nerolidol synthase 1 chloroplastic [Euphorbia peplus]|nr:(3S 6E)-nerolidol synthase 1 chloroplastic [Euphorbia peplus]
MATLSKPAFDVFHSIPSTKIRTKTQAMSIHTSHRRSTILEDETLENMCNSRSKKLKEARTVLKKASSSSPSPESLKMVDSLFRLGIDYHFRDEISSILEPHYDLISTNHHQSSDLSLNSLRFRLLRQEGYYVPADSVFKKFTAKNGKFRRELTADIGGLTELYEASQLSVPGEEILDEAAVFSGRFLAGDQGRIVADALNFPVHRSFRRPAAGDFGNGFEDIFKQLGLFDFNMIQSFHQQEISQISMWWRDLGLSKELKFPKDQPMDWFIWPMACFTGPTYSGKRVELAKVISLLNLVIDVFDLVGTIDQLSLFVQAINRWEIAAAEDLPDYMKICFKAIYDITNDIAHNMHKELGFNPIISLRKEWSRLCNALLEDATCLAVGKLPISEEYLKNTIVTSGVNLVMLHTFLLLNQGVTEENVEIVNNNPGILSSVSTILRLSNDLKSTKFGKGKKSYGSYMLCYMKENEGSSIDDARQHVMIKISETRKKLNWECLISENNHQFSKSFNKAALNLARLAPNYMYESFDILPSLEHEEDIMKHMMFQRIIPTQSNFQILK